MTKQDEITKFSGDRLKDFLNFNFQDEDAILDFCKYYNFHLLDTSQGWKVAFTNEQQKIKEILLRFNEGSITSQDLDFISSKRKGASKRLLLIEHPKFLELKDKLAQLNGNEVYYDDFPVQKNGQHIIDAEYYPNPVSSLWSELIKYMRSKNKIKQCKDCHQFFLINKHSPWQKFCSKVCQDRYSKK